MIVGIFKKFGWVFNGIPKSHYYCIVIYLVALCVATIFAMPIFEGPDSPFALKWNCFWWWVVTVTTVGYGDISPATKLGQSLAIIIMFSGIGVVAFLFGDMLTIVLERRRRKLEGRIPLNNKEEHVLIISDRSLPQILDVVNESMLDDDDNKKEVVLCSTSISENPLPGKIDFLHPDSLNSHQCMEDCSAAKAKRVYIWCEDDRNTVITTLAVNSVNTTGRIIINLDELEHKKDILALNIGRKNEICVAVNMAGPMMIQEGQDPGLLETLYELLSNQQDKSHRECYAFYREDVPQSIGEFTFKQLQDLFRNQFNALIFSLSDDGFKTKTMVPSDETVVSGGTAFQFIAPKRPKNIGWSELVVEAAAPNKS